MACDLAECFVTRAVSIIISGISSSHAWPPISYSLCFANLGQAELQMAYIRTWANITMDSKNFRMQRPLETDTFTEYIPTDIHRCHYSGT